MQGVSYSVGCGSAVRPRPKATLSALSSGRLTMARFYGTVQGGRGEATRLGHASTGLRVTAQSWSGDILVNLGPDGQDEDYDWVTISARPHGGGNTVILYSGRLAPLLSHEGHDKLVLEMAERGLEREARAAGVTGR